MTPAHAARRGRGDRRAGVVVLLSLLLGASARGEVARRVVLVVPEPLGPTGGQVLARVRGELQAAAFEVEAQSVAADVDRRAAVEGAVRKADARVAFGIFFDGGTAEIWVSDGPSGRTVVQTLPLGDAPPERRAAVAAVKAVDLLKATLAEVWSAEPAARAIAAAPAPHPPPAPEATVPAAPPPAPPRTRLDLGAGAAWIGAGSVNTWSPLLALAAFRGQLGARIIATGFGSSAVLDQPAGSARLAYSLALGELALRRPIGRFEIRAGAAVGAARLAVDGAGAPGYQGNAARVWSGVAGGGIGAALALGRITVALDARVLAAATATAVRVAGEEIVRVGRPIACVAASVAVRL